MNPIDFNKKTKNINRYLVAQETWHIQALIEMKSGRKSGHWMWFIFPQLDLGMSPISKYYAIQNKQEAICYLNHPILGYRLTEITNVLLHINEINPAVIFGPIDSVKFQSSMTLFSIVSQKSDNNFDQVLVKFYGGQRCELTTQMLRSIANY